MGRSFAIDGRRELAASDALADTGEVPKEAAAALRAHASFEVDRIHEIERETKHDVIAFTTAVAEKMKAAGQADASRWLHYGLTSNDIVDTAQALVLQQASELLLKGSCTLLESLKERDPSAVAACEATAGLSLGEYTALVFAGALSFEDGLKVVQRRGEAMQAAAATMLKLIGREAIIAADAGAEDAAVDAPESA